MKKIGTLMLVSTVALCSLAYSQINYGIQTKTSNCTGSELPDTSCSPGAILTTNTGVICKIGYTKTVRNVPLSVRKKVFAEYGIPYSQAKGYEVDHIISLELGGSNDISNLFPQISSGAYNSHIKDRLENFLHKQVCLGKLDIKEAQKQISTNWIYYYQQYLVR